MNRRPIRTGDDQDVHTTWRRRYVWTQRAAATAAVKRCTRRWERHQARRETRLQRRAGTDG